MLLMYTGPRNIFLVLKHEFFTIFLYTNIIKRIFIILRHVELKNFCTFNKPLNDYELTMNIIKGTWKLIKTYIKKGIEIL